MKICFHFRNGIIRKTNVRALLAAKTWSDVEAAKRIPTILRFRTSRLGFDRTFHCLRASVRVPISLKGEIFSQETKIKRKKNSDKSRQHMIVDWVLQALVNSVTEKRGTEIAGTKEERKSMALLDRFSSAPKRSSGRQFQFRVRSTRLRRPLYRARAVHPTFRTWLRSCRSDGSDATSHSLKEIKGRSCSLDSDPSTPSDLLSLPC